MPGQWRELNRVNKRRKKIVSRWVFACTILVFAKQQRSDRRCIFTEDMTKKSRITVVGIIRDKTKPYSSLLPRPANMNTKICV